jgi:hypothetical protein
VMAPQRPLATQPPNTVSARLGKRYCRETAKDMNGRRGDGNKTLAGGPAL